MITDLINGTLGLVTTGLTYLRAVEDLPSKKELLDNLEQHAIKAPCVYAIYEGGRFDRPHSTARRQTGDPTVILAVIARSLRDSHGQAASVQQDGAYQIMDDLRSTLVGQVPASGFGQLELVSEGLAGVKRGIVCYLIQYRASYTITPAPLIINSEPEENP